MTVSTEQIPNSLKEFNLPQKLISLIEMSIIETFVKIKAGAVETEPILVKSGLGTGRLHNNFIELNF